MLQNKHEDRILFIKLFTEQLILARRKQLGIFPEEFPLRLEKKAKEEPTKEGEEFQESLLHISREEIFPSQKTQFQRQRISPVLIPTQPVRKIIPIEKTKYTIPIQKYEVPPPPLSEERAFDLSKLNTLLTDPSISAIECPGPHKLINVRQRGIIKTTQLTLTKEDIEEILRKFSQETKIPVISGVFKVSTRGLAISAIISEVVGTRFMISKIPPVPNAPR